jgi:hypothetical protein
MSEPDASTQSPAVTIGLALDVSGSMESNIANYQGGELARLDGLRDAIELLMEEAARLSGLASPAERQTPINIFVYAFGLKVPNVGGACDLLRLMDLVRIAEPITIEMAQDYERRLHTNERAVAIEVMGWQAADLLNMSRAEAEAVLRGRIKERVAKAAMERIFARIAGRTLKDLTLSVGSMMERWSTFRESLSTGNELLGGNTPMCACLSMIRERFARERARHPDCSRFVLLIVSDGEPTDGDPSPIAREVAEAGVEIVSCFVAPQDMTGSKELYSKPQSSWSNGAIGMFDIAASASAASPELKFLLERGWHIHKESPRRSFSAMVNRLRGRIQPEETPRLFAQVNHSEHLQEFMQVVLAPLRLESESTA